MSHKKLVPRVPTELRGQERFEKLRQLDTVPNFAKEEPRDLPTWARAALTRMVLYGDSFEDAAAVFNRKPKTLQHYSSSPAGQKWRASLTDATNDPAKMAEMTLGTSALGVTLEYLAALEQARVAGDYHEVGVMSRDILDRIGIERKKDPAQDKPASIVINLNGVSLEVPTVKASFDLIEEGDTVDAEVVDE